MDILTAKQQARIEKKKRKLAALANITQLNDKDRLDEAMANRTSVDEDEAIPKAHPDADDDGFIKVTHKKKSLKNVATHDSTDGPETKRAKVSNAAESNDEGTVSDGSTAADEHMRHMKLTLTKEQYKDLKRQLRERKRQLENVPSIRLREFGERATLAVSQEERTPIFLTDIQHLVMSALIGKKSPCTPDRWCFVDKVQQLSHTLVVLLEGLSLYHYLSNESKFVETNKIFETRLEVMMPPCKEGMMMEELVQVPLTNVQAGHLIEQYGSLEAAIELNKDPTLLVKAIFPMEHASEDNGCDDLHPNDKFPRTKLLLSALQMVDEGYPMPLRGQLNNHFQNYVFTKSKYAPVTNRSPMFGVDCEMCRTSIGINELTRISIVNEEMETVYETLVMPTNKIVDYLTKFSGITPELMKTVTKTLQDVHRDVRNLLPPDAILVGQSLNCDLNAMRMMHPYVIDTSVCFNISGQRRRKSKLQKLAMTFLKEAIQEYKGGHDSIEDSKTSLKLVQMKLANNLEFGDEVLMQKKRLHDIIRAASGGIKNNLFACASQRDKRTAIVTTGTLRPSVRELLKKSEEISVQDSLKAVTVYELESNKETVRKTREIVLENALTIANLQLNTAQLQLDSIDSTVGRVDKWIEKLWKSVAHNGMMLVLMGGAADCPSAVAKIAIKRNVADVAADVPIAV